MFKLREIKKTDGYSLVELLVAATIFLLIVLAVYGIYDLGQKSYKTGQEASNLQQRIRIAHDTITRDLRLTGYDALRDVNPADNSPDTLDEQIEGAWKHAITIRANFDHDEPATNIHLHGRETDYESTAVPIVTISNDEIVTYALANSGASNSTNLKMDLSKPRDAALDDTKEETTPAINGIALNDNNSPPYTLYKITFSDDDNPSMQKVPIAENIASLVFKYYDGTGAEIEPGTTYSGVTIATTGIGGADNRRNIREKIDKVEVIITGMNEAPELGVRVSDPNNPPAPYNDTDGYTIVDGKAYRIFRVSSTIRPPNMGLMLRPESDLEPPSPPDEVHLHGGHFGRLIADWAYDDTSAVDDMGIVTFKVELYGGGFGDAALETFDYNISGASSYYRYMFDSANVTDGSDYDLKVWAIDVSGNVSENATGTDSPETAVNTTTPKSPQGMSASGVNDPNDTPGFYNDDTIAAAADGDGTIVVNWSAPDENTSGTVVTCPFADDPDYRDAGGYRIYRARAVDDSGTTLETANTDGANGVGENPAGITADESILWPGGESAAMLVDETALTGTTYIDSDVYPCDLYVYLTKAVDEDPAKTSVSFSDYATLDGGLASEGVPGYAFIDGTLVPRTPGSFSLVSTLTDSADTAYDLEFSWGEPASTSTFPYKTNDYVIYEWDDTQSSKLDEIPVYDYAGGSTFVLENRIPKAGSTEVQEERYYSLVALNPCDFLTVSAETAKLGAPLCDLGGSSTSQVTINTAYGNYCNDVRVQITDDILTEYMPDQATLTISDIATGNTVCQVSITGPPAAGAGYYYYDFLGMPAQCPTAYDSPREVDIVASVTDTQSPACTVNTSAYPCVVEPSCCIGSALDDLAMSGCVQLSTDSSGVVQVSTDETVHAGIYDQCYSDVQVTDVYVNWDYGPGCYLQDIYWDGVLVFSSSNNAGTTLNPERGSLPGTFELFDPNTSAAPILPQTTDKNNPVHLEFVFSGTCWGVGDWFDTTYYYIKDGNSFNCGFAGSVGQCP